MFAATRNTADPAALPPVDESAEHETKQAKRQKVSTACDQCRTKKIKCDGIQPRCGPCSSPKKIGNACTWVHGSLRSSAQASRERIQRLEKTIQELQTTGDVHTINSTEGPEENADLSSLTPQSTLPVADHPSERLEEPQTAPLTSSTSASNASCGFAGSVTSAMLGSTDPSAQASGFYGSSSFGKFIGQVRKAVDRKMGVQGSHRSEHMDHLASVEPTPEAAEESPFQRDTIEYVLPSRKRADLLMTTYWQVVHPLYPFLDEAETMHSYESLWSGQGNVPNEAEFLCIINTIFALSCQLNTTVAPSERQQAADTFFGRVQKTINFWKSSTTQTVQLYLLIAQYLQSTDDPHQCWMFVGLAVRAAQGLGFHLSETLMPIASPKQRELALRLWNGCILMDRFIAMTHGRPTMINRSLVSPLRLPAAVDDEYIPVYPGPFQQPEDQPSKVHFFNETLKLYVIMDDILLSFYAHERDQTHGKECKNYFGILNTSHDVPSMLEIDNKLYLWEKDLPSHLKDYRTMAEAGKVASSRERHTVYFRQALVLRQRFLHVRLLLLRPILSNFVATDSDDVESEFFGTNLRRRLAHQCSVVCVKVAQEAVEIVQKFRKTDWATTGVLAAWWYNTFYVYSAATVLIAARLRSSVAAEVGHDSLMESWNAAMEVLQSYSVFSPSIPKLIVTLQMLSEELPTLYSFHRQQAHHESRPDTLGVNDHGAAAVNPGDLASFGGNIDEYGFSIPADSHYGAGMAGAEGDDMLMHLSNTAFDPNDFSWLNDMPYSWNWELSSRT